MRLPGTGVDRHFGGMADPASTLADASAMSTFFARAPLFLVPLAMTCGT